MPEIIVAGLSKAFGQGRALSDVSFSVRDKEFLTLLGPSGCGKTTTLMSIAGFQRPDEGTISCGDRIFFDRAGKVDLAAEDRNLGMVFQSYAIWPHLTVFGNVAFPLKIRRMKKDALRRRVLETLQLVEMAGYAGRYPHELSGGQQQRVALARALVYSPAVLLLDEPFLQPGRQTAGTSSAGRAAAAARGRAWWLCRGRAVLGRAVAIEHGGRGFRGEPAEVGAAVDRHPEDRRAVDAALARLRPASGHPTAAGEHADAGRLVQRWAGARRDRARGDLRARGRRPPGGDLLPAGRVGAWRPGADQATGRQHRDLPGDPHRGAVQGQLPDRRRARRHHRRGTASGHLRPLVRPDVAQLPQQHHCVRDARHQSELRFRGIREFHCCARRVVRPIGRFWGGARTYAHPPFCARPVGNECVAPCG